MRATMTVDPRLISLLGDKLYSAHPLPIVVRELLQNSRDACIRKGVEPDIHIIIEVDYNGGCIVTCEDNGIGMTEEQLVNDFLCLGNTSKSKDANAVGGFGIAKAALMRNPEWAVESLDNYIDQSFIFEGKEIEKRAYRNGTKITVMIKDRTYYTVVRQALRMIYFSDVDVYVRTIVNNEDYEDYHAGWCGGQVTRLDNGNMWDGFRFDECKYSKEPGVSLSGSTVVRLNGLVQFTTTSYATNREFNVLIELSTTERPDSKDYPLTMSREELVGDVRTEVQELISACNINPLTMARDEPENDTVRHEKGYNLRGKRNVERYVDDIFDIDFSSMKALPAGEIGDANNYSHQNLLLIGYKKEERNVKADKKILAVWREIVMECAKYEDTFGIGLIIDPHVRAARQYQEGDHFYVLNPEVILSLPTLEERVHVMHSIACHEVAHHDYSLHDEMHASLTSQIYIDTISAILSNMTRYKKALR